MATIGKICINQKKNFFSCKNTVNVERRLSKASAWWFYFDTKLPIEKHGNIGTTIELFFSTERNIFCFWKITSCDALL